MEQEFRFEEGAKDMASGVGTGAGLSTLRFQGMTESITPMCPTLLTNLARIYRIPVGSGPGPKARRKETRLPIVATSSGRLFLNGLLASMARLRFTDTRNLTCKFHKPGKRGHFYFASMGTFLLCLDTQYIGDCVG
jgi:hypothetical protein